MDIKELRIKAGCTQQDFAERLSIPIGTLRNWEQGTRKCPSYVIELIKYRLEH